MNALKNILFIILPGILCIACKNEVPETPAENHQGELENVVELSAAQMKTADIVLGKIEERQISGTIKVNGVLDVPPQQLVSISAPLGGFLKSTVSLKDQESARQP